MSSWITVAIAGNESEFRVLPSETVLCVPSTSSGPSAVIARQDGAYGMCTGVPARYVEESLSSWWHRQVLGSQESLMRAKWVTRLGSP